MTKFVKGSGNVFADLGLPDADIHLVKAGLVLKIAKTIESKRLSQAAAAEKLGISQPDVSKILRGQFRSVTVERLIKWLNALGQDVEIAVKPARRREQGKLTCECA